MKMQAGHLQWDSPQYQLIESGDGRPLYTQFAIWSNHSRGTSTLWQTRRMQGIRASSKIILLLSDMGTRGVLFVIHVM